jgi:hypothetical protein
MDGPLRLRSVVAIVVVVWVIVGVAGCCQTRSEPTESTSAQALFTSPSSEFAVNADHATADCAVSQACPQAFAPAVLPPSATALIALMTAVVAAVVIGSVAHCAALVRRAPPRDVLVVLSGQDVLMRFCLARR